MSALIRCALIVVDAFDLWDLLEAVEELNEATREMVGA